MRSERTLLPPASLLRGCARCCISTRSSDSGSPRSLRRSKRAISLWHPRCSRHTRSQQENGKRRIAQESGKGVHEMGGETACMSVGGGEGRVDPATLMILRASAGERGKVEIGGRVYIFSSVTTFHLLDAETGFLHIC